MAHSLVEMLCERASQQPAQLAYRFIRDGEDEVVTVTYAELDRLARAVAARLQRHTRPGDRVLLIHPPGIPYISAFFGCLYARVVAVPAYPPDPLRPQRTVPRLRRIVEDAQIRVISTEAMVARAKPMLTQLAPELGAVEWITMDDIGDDEGSAWTSEWPHANELAMLQYTSGSTSAPKGVVLRHQHLMTNLAATNELLELRGSPGCVSWLPPYHDMGLIGATLQTVFNGHTTTLFSPLHFMQRPLRWLQAISRSGADFSAAPNFAYDLCVRKISAADKRSLDLSRLRLLLNGAEPIAADTLARFSQAFACCGLREEVLLPAYGLAEATLIVAAGGVRERAKITMVGRDALGRGELRDASGEDRVELVSCGRPAPATAILIVDPSTGAETGDVGEIWVRGPGVAAGYWNQPEINEEVFGAHTDDGRGPYLRTGDLGFIRAGELYVTGRITEQIIIRGRNFYPTDIEASVRGSHPAIRPGGVAAFATHDQGRERLAVAVEINQAWVDRIATRKKAAGPARRSDRSRSSPASRERDPTAAQDVVAAVRAAVALDHGLQVTIVVLLESGQLPKTTSGKLQRLECGRALASGALDALVIDRIDPLDATDPLDPVDEPRERETPAVLAAERRVLLELWLDRRIDASDLERTPAELGFDSLELVRLAQRASRSWGVDLDPTEALSQPLRALLARPRARSAPVEDRTPTDDRVVWDIRDAAPEVLDSLLESSPELAELLAVMRESLPTPPTNNVFDDGTWFRPEGHFRAIYRRLGQGQGQGQDQAGAAAATGAVIAVKGAELRCPDQRGFLQLLHHRRFERYQRYSITSTLEYFILQERKVPGAVTLTEALAEAERAARLQSAFLTHYAELGAFPVPLLVWRWSPRQTERFGHLLAPLLGGQAREQLGAELERGLACYVYWLGCPPAPRISHFANQLAAEAARTGLSGLANTPLIYTTLRYGADPRATLDGLLGLVAQILAAGWFPCNTRQFKSGQAVEPQNVLLSGAIVDMDSLVEFSELDGDRQFYEHLLALLNLLCGTVRTLLAAEGDGTTATRQPFPAQFAAPDFLDTLGVIYVWEQLRERLARVANSEQLDPRLAALVDGGLSFPALFDRILRAIYYQGVVIPEQALNLMTVTHAYDRVGLAGGRRVDQAISYRADLELDSVALATLPRSFLDTLGIPRDDFITNFLHDEPALITIFDTSLGRIGLVVVPLRDDRVYVDAGQTRAAVEAGLDFARDRGVRAVSLTGLIPSATDGGRGLAGEDLMITTGHATTIASFVMVVERVLGLAGRSLVDEEVAVIGLGSIGAGALRALLASSGHPRELILVDLPSKRDQLEALARALVEEFEFCGKIRCLEFVGELPAAVYESRFVLSATSVPGILEVERLLPGTIVIDDSAPHCFDPERARRRFLARRDILFSEAGAIEGPQKIGEINELSFSTGWDQRIRNALRLVHPSERVIMGCVFSSLLTIRYDELAPTIGEVGPEEVARHLQRLRALGFRGAAPYCRDFTLAPELIAEFRGRYGARTRASQDTRETS